jgi:hypothetical protein
MSEFKFACPVCGQHMMCDISHGGSVMECPTCFQKIVAPHAPAPGTKLILTGTKLTEKKKVAHDQEDATATPDEPKQNYIWIIIPVLVAVLVAAGAGAYFFGGKLVSRHYDWTASDIGDVRVPGTFSRAGETLTLAGSGADIWFQADAFRYVYLKLNGDGVITTRVLNMKNTDTWAKAGVMFRESLNPDSAYALAFVSPSSGIAFQQRDRTAASASAIWNIPDQAAPYWIRLVRQGDAFSAFASADGAEWTQMGTTKISMGGQVYAGLVVCSHNAQTLCQAQFDRVTVEGGTKAAPPAHE